jgi:hypothetical protein
MSLSFSARAVSDEENQAIDEVIANVATSSVPYTSTAIAFAASRANTLRFIRGFPGNGGPPEVPQATAALLSTAEWRAGMIPDGVPKACSACAKNAEAHCIVPLGPTRLGAPLLYMSAPRARNLVVEDCVEHLVEALERSFENEGRRMHEGETVPTATAEGKTPLLPPYAAGAWVFDGRGFSILQSAMNPSVGIAYARTLQNRFPERLGRCLLVDVNWAFTMFWRIIRPFIATATSDKVIEVAGRNALIAGLDELQVTDEQKKWVLEAFDLEALPGNLPSWPLPSGSPVMGTLLPRGPVKAAAAAAAAATSAAESK